ncbi:hemin uptake protein HemP [Polynucleobacter sp. MWH-UH35A]|uniref:hemin uptake protein HemP n=1 Tax=Polynucleobacter sp. MWH-UH35A TaxID=1855619 RepID=UPI00203F186C|nr:hemin uptake protein HemP [Polynucleobacter sp. MWH-UH35A]
MIKKIASTTNPQDECRSYFLSKTISSEALLGHMKQICILHDGQVYQLRITKLGKLILTK